jgi:Na+-transporting methylmalonyl-CoA/oxaloacetate decarboxylase gamma subunit
MKSAHIFLSSLIFISSCMSAFEIRFLDQKKINQHAQEIEKKVARDYYLRMALVGMVAARIAYAGFVWLNTPHEEKNLITPEKPTVDPNITYWQWMCDVTTSWVNWGSHLVSKESIQHGLVNFGKFAITTTFQTSMGFVMEGVYGKLNYPNTLRWYICSHVPYTATIKMMKEMLQEEHCDKQLVQELCNRLGADGEKLCGYMVYKTKQLEIEEQQIAERTTRYFFTHYNEFLKRLSDQLASDTVDYNSLDSMLTSFETDIKRQFKLFFFIEGETDEERAMINQKMKLSFIGHAATLF